MQKSNLSPQRILSFIMVHRPFNVETKPHIEPMGRPSQVSRGSNASASEEPTHLPTYLHIDTPSDGVAEKVTEECNKNARFCSKELRERAVAPRNLILFEHLVNQSVH